MIDLRKYKITAVEFDREYYKNKYPLQSFKKALFYAEEYLEKHINWEVKDWEIDGFPVSACLGIGRIVFINWVKSDIPFFLIDNNNEAEIIWDSYSEQIIEVRRLIISELERLTHITSFERDKRENELKEDFKLFEEKNIKLETDFKIKESPNNKTKGRSYLYKIQTFSFLFLLYLSPFILALINQKLISSIIIIIIIFLLYLFIMAWISMYYKRLKKQKYAGIRVLADENNEFIIEKMWSFKLFNK